MRETPFSDFGHAHQASFTPQFRMRRLEMKPAHNALQGPTAKGLSQARNHVCQATTVQHLLQVRLSIHVQQVHISHCIPKLQAQHARHALRGATALSARRVPSSACLETSAPSVGCRTSRKFHVLEVLISQAPDRPPALIVLQELTAQLDQQFPCCALQGPTVGRQVLNS